MAARYKAPAIKAAVPKPTRLVQVYTSGVVHGTVHQREVMDDGSMAERTVCGNWPSATPVTVHDKLCPVCFPESSTSERTSK